jgi:hypothetical protein
MAMKKSLNNPNKPATKTKTVKGPVRDGSPRVKLTTTRGSNSTTYSQNGVDKGSVRNADYSAQGTMRKAASAVKKGTLNYVTTNPTKKGKTANKTARGLMKKGLM